MIPARPRATSRSSGRCAGQDTQASALQRIRISNSQNNSKPSLRAKRSNPSRGKGSMDCVVASLLAMTVTQSRCDPIQMRVRIPATHCARAAENSSPSKSEGAGNAGCALHPRSRVQCAQEDAHTSIQVQRRQSDIPCAMVLRLIARSPR
jgi:hypothetical protein